MRKSQANRARIAARAPKSQPNHALLTTGPVGSNLIARVEPTAAARIPGRNRAPKISTGQVHWNRPATLPYSVSVVSSDIRWS